MDLSRHQFDVKGKTAEEIVYDLAVKTLLTDWCYPNPKLPNGKELCDLLVVFDQVAIIWQIKDLRLNSHGQYRRSEVAKNLRQLSGARRHIFDLRTPLELENPRRSRERFDPTSVKEVYLISALLGEGEPIFSMVEFIRDYTAHVFDREFIQIVLEELDTIGDFTNYLRAKEALIANDQDLLIVGGEQELLAFYLLNNRSFEELKDATSVVIDEGSWQHFQDDPRYKAKKAEDEISYGWDDIINRAHEGSTQYEIVARELARPSRFQRRLLSKVFFDAQSMAHEDHKHNIFRRVMPSEGTTYCFVFVDEGASRQFRREMLHTTCFVARGKYQNNKKVLGIATEKHFAPMCSYDFCFVDAPGWTGKDEANMERIQTKTGILVDPAISRIHEDEYPGTEQ